MPCTQKPLTTDLQTHLTLEHPRILQKQMPDTTWMISVPLKRCPDVGTYPNLPTKQYWATQLS